MGENTANQDSLVDKWTRRAKDNPLVAAVLVAGVVVGGLASVGESWTKLRKALAEEKANAAPVVIDKSDHSTSTTSIDASQHLVVTSQHSELPESPRALTSVSPTMGNQPLPTTSAPTLDSASEESDLKSPVRFAGAGNRGHAIQDNAPRIPTSVAPAVHDGIELRGGGQFRDLLVKALQSTAGGKCPANIMGETLLDACQQQMPGMGKVIAQKGSIKEALFRGIQQMPSGPAEVYRVQFERGSMTWVLNTGADGKLFVLWSSASQPTLDGVSEESVPKSPARFAGIPDGVAQRGSGRFRELLIRALQSTASGKCPADIMGAMLLDACEQQMPEIGKAIAQKGSIKEAVLRGVQQTQSGPAEVYLVEFGRGAMTWVVNTSTDGKLFVLWSSGN